MFKTPRNTLSMVALLALSVLSSGPASADTTTALRAYYCFESSAVTDCSGNRNTGIAEGDVTLVPGRIGQGARFGGFDSLGYIRVPNKKSLTLTNNFTIAYWAKVNSFVGIDGYNQRVEYGIQMPLAKSFDTRGLFTELVGGVSNTPMPDGSPAFLLNAPLHFSGQGSVEGRFEPYALGEWVHVAYTFIKSTGTLKLYTNGRLKSTAVLGNIDMTRVASDDLYLGAQAPLAGRNVYQYPFNGVLDDVRIYSRPLAALDIAELFGTGRCDNLSAGAP